MQESPDQDMDYKIHQSGRAATDFLVDFRNLSNALEPATDAYAENAGVAQSGERDAAMLQKEIAPLMQQSPAKPIWRGGGGAGDIKVTLRM